MMIMNKRETQIWKRLIELEPTLGIIFDEAGSVVDDINQPSFCANEYWAKSSLKFQVGCYVGPEALTKNPELKGAEAFTIAYTTIYRALPPCRNCGCD